MAQSTSVSSTAEPDFAALRNDFPIFRRTVHGKPLTYLDSAATSQKPEQVLRVLDHFYRESNANIHRGVYALSEEATAAHEHARARIATFIGAAAPEEVIFVRNTTEAINLVAYSWGRSQLRPGDRIVLTELEHHSNLVPWQLLASERDLTLDFVPIDACGRLDLAELYRLLEQGPRLVALTHVSNALGTINPIATIIQRAHQHGALVLVDGAQSVPHLGVDARALGCDFLAFSGHKMLGPTGIGVLWGRRELLEAMPPFLGGGDMIREVRLAGSTWNDLPHKFEAGTPAILEAVGLGAAVDYLSALGMPRVAAHEQALVQYAMPRLQAIPELTIYGPPAERRGGVVSFALGEIHPHDLATLLDREGIAVRAGQHCAQPLHDHLGVAATARASFSVYTSSDEIDALADSLMRAREVFAF